MTGTTFTVAKYDASGNLVWTKGSVGGLIIGVDGLGNSYVTGNFSGSATFGPGETNETVLMDAGSSDIFVAKYGIDGALLWAKPIGNSNFDPAGAIAVDASGNSYVTGSFRGSVTFGSGEANETVLTSIGISYDIFAAKYDANGYLQWVKQAGGGSTRVKDIAVDALGNSYVTGYFYSRPTVFGLGEAHETTLIPDDELVFIAKYGSNGELAWAKQTGSTGGYVVSNGSGIDVDGSGNVYVTGYFEGTSIFGPGEANETVLTSAT